MKCGLDSGLEPGFPKDAAQPLDEKIGKDVARAFRHPVEGLSGDKRSSPSVTLVSKGFPDVPQLQAAS